MALSKATADNIRAAINKHFPGTSWKELDLKEDGGVEMIEFKAPPGEPVKSSFMKDALQLPTSYQLNGTRLQEVQITFY